jgi:hypothetical protein
LRGLTNDIGIWEHALHSEPRQEHGFCTDDNARALVIVTREQTEDVRDLAAVYAAFVFAARRSDGTFHNRRDATGTWMDETASDDSQGRSWWALGFVARHAREPWMRTAALEEFESCAAFESPHLRSNAYATLGAVEIVMDNPRHQPALEMLDRTSTVIAVAARSAIPWPEPRLSYDNARIPEALIAAGVALNNQHMTRIGLRLLEWLALNETQADRFSFTPVGGRTPGDRDPGFDQQPIEAWAMADACYRAWSLTGASHWRRRGLQAAKWLLGANDGKANLYDTETGGTYDGLTPQGVNENQGAESTLAGIGTLQVGANCLQGRV